MKNKYTVTYKVAERGSTYTYQKDTEKNKAGSSHPSPGGHMWYVFSDGNGKEESYGFESVNGKVFDVGKVTQDDNAAYQQTSYEVTIALTANQYNKLKAFSEEPWLAGFNDKNIEPLIIVVWILYIIP